jgi:hypothetical protein
MKNTILLPLLLAGFCGFSQTAVQTINSGSVLAASSSVSIGEIVIPQNANQPASGLVSIVAQLNQQFLETPEFGLADDVTVYPNPTAAGLFFKSSLSFAGKTVRLYAATGQLAAAKTISPSNGIDLSGLAPGVYLVNVDGYQKSFKIIKR